jgi:hypothetical protein
MEPPISINNIRIDIPLARWRILTEGHPEIKKLPYELQETIENPDTIFQTQKKEKIAVREYAKGKHIAALYRESPDGRGMLLTAYITRDLRQFEDLRVIWMKDM